MLKIVTCPELDCTAKLQVSEPARGRRERVLYCSLWKSEEVIESCEESCVRPFAHGKRRR